MKSAFQMSVKEMLLCLIQNIVFCIYVERRGGAGFFSTHTRNREIKLRVRYEEYDIKHISKTLSSTTNTSIQYSLVNTDTAESLTTIKSTHYQRFGFFIPQNRKRHPHSSGWQYFYLFTHRALQTAGRKKKLNKYLAGISVYLTGK